MNVNGFLDLPSWANGLVELPWWGYIAVALLMTHITIASVTIYLHRHSAHRALEMHPVVAHFFRLWLWLTTGMSTKAWTAIHRKHHAKCESEEDPHSPQVLTLKKVMLEGGELYRKRRYARPSRPGYRVRTCPKYPGFSLPSDTGGV